MTTEKLKELRELSDMVKAARKEAESAGMFHWLWRSVDVAETKRNLYAGHALADLLAHIAEREEMTRFALSRMKSHADQGCLDVESLKDAAYQLDITLD